MPHLVDDNEALRRAFNDLGDQLASLQRRASDAALRPTITANEVAVILSGLILALRTTFPTTEGFRSVGDIAASDVIPRLLEQQHSDLTKS